MNIDKLLNYIYDNKDIYILIRETIIKLISKKNKYDRYILNYKNNLNKSINIDISYIYNNINKSFLINSLFQRIFKKNHIFYINDNKYTIKNIYKYHISYIDDNINNVEQYIYINTFINLYYERLIKLNINNKLREIDNYIMI